MTVKALSRPLVDFYTSSPRVAQAFRTAVRQQKNLRQLSTLRNMRSIDGGQREDSSAHAIGQVVLSYAEDNPLASEGPQIKSWRPRKAHHVLFTEPTTNPDRIAQWTKSVGSHSSSQLYVAQVASLDDPKVSQILRRICSVFRRNGAGGIIDAYLAGEALVVRGPGFRKLEVPIDAISCLRGRPPEVLRNLEVDPDGSFVYWPELDVHLGWDQFLQVVDPEALRRAQQKSEEFNRQYGAAIRKVREEAGIRQSKVPGLTERQVRRIERGECRATSAALASLAEAHGLDTNAYLKRLAEALPSIVLTKPRAG